MSPSTMKLTVLSDYGAKERVVSDGATADVVTATMESLDWQEFHQVILETPDGDWMEVGGSLDPGDGLSVMYEEGGTQQVISVPPKSVDEMTRRLLLYLDGGGRWKDGVEWQ